MKRVAIVYSSENGQTHKIATAMGRELESVGVEVRYNRLGYDPEITADELETFDGVLLGGPVYVGRLPDSLILWTRPRARHLNEKPLGFFTVGLRVTDPRPEEQQVHRDLLQAFMMSTGILPTRTASFPGALRYTAYPLGKRWLMRRIAGAVGLPTDITRDHEFTDWLEVSQFGELMAQEVTGKALAFHG